MVAEGEAALWSSGKRSAPALVMYTHGAVAKESTQGDLAAHRTYCHGEPAPPWFAAKMFLTILLSIITYTIYIYIYTQAIPAHS